MIIHYNDQKLETFEHFKGGEKSMDAKMFFDGQNRILYAQLEPGASIGLHTHETNSEIIYLLEGTATVLYDGGHEELAAGNVHYCPKGHSHSLINESNSTIRFFAVVPEQ